MLSEAFFRRLAFIRYLLRLGIDQSNSPPPLSAAAILTFHDSVELFLQLSLEVLDVVIKKPQLMDYFDTINKSISPHTLSQHESMRRLNNSRVSLKHHGTMPSQFDINSFRASVLIFFENNTPLIFGVQLSTITFVHLVELPATREALFEADRCIAANDLDNANNAIALAFARELSVRQISQPSGFLRLPRFSRSNNDQIPTVVDALCHSVAELSQEVALLGNGIDVKRLHVFRKLTPIVHLLHDGSASYVNQSLPPATTSSVQYCYDYVIDTVLLLQQRQASINSLSKQ